MLETAISNWILFCPKDSRDVQCGGEFPTALARPAMPAETASAKSSSLRWNSQCNEPSKPFPRPCRSLQTRLTPKATGAWTAPALDIWTRPRRWASCRVRGGRAFRPVLARPRASPFSERCGGAVHAFRDDENSVKPTNEVGRKTNTNL